MRTGHLKEEHPTSTPKPIESYYIKIWISFKNANSQFRTRKAKRNNKVNVFKKELGTQASDSSESDTLEITYSKEQKRF